MVERVTARWTGAGIPGVEAKPDGSRHKNQAVNAWRSWHSSAAGTSRDAGRTATCSSRGKKFILATANPSTGFLSFSSMYEHGMATLALAEIYGMDPDPEIEEALRKAVDLIVKSQSPSGGWRYNPAPATRT